MRHQSPKRSSHKDDLRERLRTKRKSNENASQRHSAKKKCDTPPTQPEEQPIKIEVPNEDVFVERDSKDTKIKAEIKSESLEYPVHIDLPSGNGDYDLEEGEIDENDKQIEPKCDPVDTNRELHKSPSNALEEYQSNLEVKSPIDSGCYQRNESVQSQASTECQASAEFEKSVKVSVESKASAVDPDDSNVYMASEKTETNGQLPLSSNDFDDQAKATQGEGNRSEIEESNKQNEGINLNEGANLDEATPEPHASVIKEDATEDLLKPEIVLTEAINLSPLNIIVPESPLENIERITETIEKTTEPEKSTTTIESVPMNEHDGNNQTANSVEHKSETAIVNENNIATREQIEKNADESTQSLNDALNTSGSKLVKNISTSTKNYLIVEDENNETTIYITRKSKKKRKEPKKTGIIS